MNTTRKLLIALEEGEIQDFLTEPIFHDILELFPQHRIFDTSKNTPESYEAAIREYLPEVILSGWTTPVLPESVFDLVPDQLKYYCHVCGTVRRFFPRNLIERGLLVSNWGDAASDSVAESALFHILSCLRRGTRWAISMHKEGGWRSGHYDDNYSLLDREVGLHGFGVIAQSLVEMLRPFHVKIRAFSPSVPDEIFKEKGVERAASLEDLFSQSDVLVELAPKKPENFHMVSDELLSKLRPGSCFINVGRGAVVDTAALVKVAKEGKIQIGLDVYEEEPLPKDHPLRGLLNVSMTPHLGGPTRDQRKKSGALALENLRRYLKGDSLQFVVTAQVYDRIT